jgi:hypothetical protein
MRRSPSEEVTGASRLGSLLGDEAGLLPLQAHAHRRLDESAHLLHEAPEPRPGLWVYRHQRKQQRSERLVTLRV